jgi:hypothetical protein
MLILVQLYEHHRDIFLDPLPFINKLKKIKYLKICIISQAQNLNFFIPSLEIIHKNKYKKIIE